MQVIPHINSNGIVQVSMEVQQYHVLQIGNELEFVEVPMELPQQPSQQRLHKHVD